MWKLKAASKLAQVSSIGGSKKYGKWVHYAGFVAGGLLFVLGCIGALLDTFWIGIYCLVASLPVIFLEMGFAPVDFIVSAMNFMGDWKFRAIFFGIIGIIPLFSSATVFAGLWCLVIAGGCLFCWFKGEDHWKVTKAELCTKGTSDEEASNSNARKSRSLASTDATEK